MMKEDLEEYVGKEIYSLFYAMAGDECEETDSGTILKVTPGALHIDTSRHLRDYSQKTDLEATYPAKLTLIIPLANILSIEIDMESNVEDDEK